MPSWRAVYDWIDEDEDFASRIAHARILGFDAIAESTLEIADDATNDWMDKQTPSGTVTVLNAEHVQRSKLRIETRLKLLAKWSPAKYGEKTSMELTGADGGPVQISDTERAARIAAILAAAQVRKDSDISDLV